mmetsp:Transcript_8406/g.18405  ORF Transcript_8406/g.18405 Transcript_8406/m.18405 type:complete len:250 (+) Transcript_8406:101-850(+)
MENLRRSKPTLTTSRSSPSLLETWPCQATPTSCTRTRSACLHPTRPASCSIWGPATCSPRPEASSARASAARAAWGPGASATGRRRTRPRIRRCCACRPLTVGRRAPPTQSALGSRCTWGPTSACFQRGRCAIEILRTTRRCMRGGMTSRGCLVGRARSRRTSRPRSERCTSLSVPTLVWTTSCTHRRRDPSRSPLFPGRAWHIPWTTQSPCWTRVPLCRLRTPGAQLPWTPPRRTTPTHRLSSLSTRW